MLEARNVSYSVDGQTLVRDVSLAVEPGSVLALIGPNGAGKTTLLKLLAGDLEPTAGEVRLDEKPLKAYSVRELALRRAVMAQNTILAFPFEALQVALMGRHPHIDRRGETYHDYEIAKAAIGRTEMAAFEQRVYPTLSGGEQSRITMARVLAQEAPILLLDEPTTHLDPRHQHLVLDMASELAEEGAAVVAVLHDLNLAATHADRVGVMAKGRLQALGHPWEALTEELLEEVFHLRFQRIKHPQQDCPLLVPLRARLSGPTA